MFPDVFIEFVQFAKWEGGRKGYREERDKGTCKEKAERNGDVRKKAR
jgi:hypothetical protein